MYMLNIKVEPSKNKVQVYQLVLHHTDCKLSLFYLQYFVYLC